MAGITNPGLEEPRRLPGRNYIYTEICRMSRNLTEKKGEGWPGENISGRKNNGKRARSQETT